MSNLIKALIAIAVAMALTSCGGGGEISQPLTVPPVSAVQPPQDTPSTSSPQNPPASQPPSTPPVTQPPSTQPPPVTQPPVTPPPVTQPPVDQPPPVTPPVTQPPVTPPVDQPPPVTPPPDQGPPPQPEARVVVEYYGDSIIWGWDGAGQDGPNGWPRVARPGPKVFADQLGYSYVDSPVDGPYPPQIPQGNVVINMGHPGYLAEDSLAGTWPYAPFSTLMSKSPATHVILEYHSHDDQTPQRLQQLIQIAKSYGKKVIVETIGPGNHSGGLDYHTISNYQKQAAQAENVPVIDQTSYLDGVMQSTGKTLTQMFPDSLHPNQDTYLIKGKYASQRFTEIK